MKERDFHSRIQEAWTARPSLIHELSTLVVPEPIILQRENHQEALPYLEIWNRARQPKKATDTNTRGALTAVELCGDSRSRVIPTISAVVHSLGTAGPKEPYRRLFDDRGIGAVMTLTHYDGRSVKQGFPPTGCGLSAAKEQGLNGSRGLEGYVGKVKYADVGLQTIFSSEIISVRTKNPVVAAMQDHLSGIIYPVYAYNDQGKQTYTEKPGLRSMLMNGAPLAEILAYFYENGIPELDPEKLKAFSPQLSTYIEQNNQYYSELRAKYSDYAEAMYSQNPAALAISTDVRSTSLKFPKTFGTPGSIFDLRVPRDKIDGTVHVPHKTFSVVLDQATYPLEHFSNLRTIYIETGTMETSRTLARRLLSREVAHNWYRQENRRILIASSIGGKVEELEDYRAAA